MNRLRLCGWLCFIGGGVLFFATGGTLVDRDNRLPWLGFLVLVAGMFLTSLAPLLENLRRRRMLRDQMDRLRSPQEPRSPNGG